MYRFFLFLLAVAVWPVGLLAQDFSGLARVDASQSKITDGWWGKVQIDLHFTQGVPYRIYTLDAPRRLVMDFQEVDWSGVDPVALLETPQVSAVRFGQFRPGWSRFVADLNAPLVVDRVDLRTDELTGSAHLKVLLRVAEDKEFASKAGAPTGTRWDLPEPADLPERVPKADGAPIIVVIDPGHGGVDPGAERDGETEKDLMLLFARELREVLLRSGAFEVVLTREDDQFVSLRRRIEIAHQVNGDVFLSLHADVLPEGQAEGATVYTLSEEASDAATAGLAERHNRADVLAGVDLSGADDQVTSILLELARQETQPRSKALSIALVTSMTKAGGPMNRQALRRAGFSVLKAADIPSVLIELGFLSNSRDLENLRDKKWRAGIAKSLRDGLNSWALLDEAVQGLVRQ